MNLFDWIFYHTKGILNCCKLTWSYASWIRTEIILGTIGLIPTQELHGNVFIKLQKCNITCRWHASVIGYTWLCRNHSNSQSPPFISACSLRFADACSKDTNCEQLCFPSANGHTCGCAIGFSLNKDGKSCDSGKTSHRYGLTRTASSLFEVLRNHISLGPCFPMQIRVYLTQSSRFATHLES